MNVALRRPMTVEEFLDWEDQQELRHEFDGYRAKAMTGGTAGHAGVQANLVAALVTRLRGKPCRVYGSELKIRLEGGIRYPDVMVVCVPVAREAKWVSDPTIVFEILSASSVHTDLVVKNAEYRAVQSVQRYVVLEQTHAGALVFSRTGADWLSSTVAGMDATLALPEIELHIPLAEIYADVGLA